MNRERLGSRLGFILLSAGCAIGVGNVLKFPWMTGQNGGGGFVLLYILCLLILGLPVMVMEFALGRAAQASPVLMYQKLEKSGHKWHFHGYLALFGNICLMAFYAVVAGWMVHYFVRFLTGDYANLGFATMITNPSVNVIILDTFVAITAGLILFPACFTYNMEVTSGPGLLFDTMATVFVNMSGGRIWGTVFFLFMVFAAMSTVLAVFENIQACVRELTGWSRPKSSVICGIVIFSLALTTALGYSVFPFQPFAEGSAWFDFWDFIVNVNLLPIGSIVIALFCCSKFGWGWDQFVAEANSGQGLKVKNWMRPHFQFIIPALVLFLYIYGLITFNWR